jgi:hypothetical protein
MATAMHISCAEQPGLGGIAAGLLYRLLWAAPAVVPRSAARHHAVASPGR